MMVLLPVEEARCCYQIVRCARVVLLLATSETSLYTNMPRDMIPAYSILQNTAMRCRQQQQEVILRLFDSFSTMGPTLMLKVDYTAMRCRQQQQEAILR